MSDLEGLVGRVRAGDHEAFRILYLNTFNDLWSFARRYVESAAVAEEIVQDVFLKLWERRERWEVRGSVRSYLLGAVRNRALHFAEHSAVERRGGDVVARGQLDAPRVDVESEVINADVDNAVVSALDTLPER